MFFVGDGSSNITNSINSVGIYLIKVNNRNTRARCQKCSKLTIKTPERRQWHCFNFDQVNADWDGMGNVPALKHSGGEMLSNKMQQFISVSILGLRRALKV